MRSLVWADGLLLLQEPEVHCPDAYSEFLGDNVRPADATTACDLTTGCGYHALRLASMGLRTVAVDTNPHAVALARKNALLNSLEGLVEVRQGDLYTALRPGELFDCIVAWPPVMPAPAEEGIEDWWTVANVGGPDGRTVFDTILRNAPAYLSPAGSLWTAHPWYFSLESTKRLAAESGLRLNLVARANFRLGPSSRARLPYLASLGFEPVLIDGVWAQEFLVLELRHQYDGK